MVTFRILLLIAFLSVFLSYILRHIDLNVKKSKIFNQFIKLLDLISIIILASLWILA
jgi:hypothetical protein